MLAASYLLYKDERTKAVYEVPQGSEIEAYRRAIEGLPGQESPGIFGMHANADLTFRSLQVGFRFQGLGLGFRGVQAGHRGAAGPGEPRHLWHACQRRSHLLQPAGAGALASDPPMLYARAYHPVPYSPKWSTQKYQVHRKMDKTRPCSPEWSTTSTRLKVAEVQATCAGANGGPVDPGYPEWSSTKY